MNLKYLFYSIASLIFVIALSSCNSDNEYKIDGELSPDGRIVSFAVDARPFTAMDSITYPALKTTQFTIQARGGYNIFNVDSLPKGTDIRSLHVTLKYANNIHTRTNLVYPKDSIVEWNETDSVKFMQVKETGKFYPEFKVVAQTGYERTYAVHFNIHKQDPDSIKWTSAGYTLSKKGETKVVINADKSKFIAFTNDKSKVYCFENNIGTTTWTELTQSGATLPTNTMVNSLLVTSDRYVILSATGTVYTSPTEGGLNWTAHSLANVNSVIGLLPEVAGQDATPLKEFLITYLNENNTLVYAKTSDFATVKNIRVTGRNDNKLISDFPLKNYSSLIKSADKEDFIILVGGKDSKDEFVQKSWMIKNISIGDDTKSILGEVSIFPGTTSKLVPYKTQVSAFLYDEKIYAISSDSLSLYHSNMGDGWIKGKKQQKLHKDMADMNLPSVVVDKDNYMWVFGGVSNKTSAYSQQIWKGRINRLKPKN